MRRQPDDPAPTSHVVVCAGPESAAAVHVMISHGFEVVETVTRAIDAVQTAAVRQPDVLLLDLTFSGTLGLRSIETIRAASPRTAVIALAPLLALVERSLEAGAFAALPIDDLRGLPEILDRLRVHPGQLASAPAVRGSVSTKPLDPS